MAAENGTQAVKKKLTALIDTYGPIALGLYFVIFLGAWAGFIGAISLGYQADGAASGAGVVGAAYVATKLTQPLRIGLTLVLTPFAARAWALVRRRPWPPVPAETTTPTDEPPTES